VNVLFVTQGVNRTFTIAPNATLYYVPKDDAGITNNLQQPVVVTSQGGKQILVINNNYRTVAPVNLSDTPGFKQSDAAAIQFLSNVHFKLNNGLSVITFIQNVSASPVTVNVTFVKDPTCTTPACNSKPTITKNGIVIQPNEVFAINPRTDNSLPGGWSGSAKIETVPASNSIIAFGNQINNVNPNAGGYAARAASNTTSAVFCPYVISGLPNYAASSQASTMLIQNVGSAPTNVTVQFVGGAGSPNGFSTTKSPVTLAVGERLSFNFRLNNAAVNGGVPSNWFGSVRVTASGGGKVAAVTNLFNKMASGSDTLGSYNCISQ
jgi:archaellum component FlaF (FlaF/FlaG flagellin family)